MQFTIPFNESLMPAEISEAYQRMITSLPDSQKIFGGDILSIARSAIETVREAMEVLKTYCDNAKFENQVSEVVFFKVVKPHFHAYLILWMAIYDLELRRPAGGAKYQVKAIKKRLNLLQDFYDRNADFYHYYRSGLNDRDESYFLRQSLGSYNFTEPHIVNADPRFSSSHDYLVALILGNEMLENYLTKALIYEARTIASDFSSRGPSKLHWTGSKTGLVELIYALQTGGVFNDGKAMVHEIATLFQEQFDVKLVNYYHTFNELRSRKKNRTAFLQNLRDTLSQKMDGLEEF